MEKEIVYRHAVDINIEDISDPKESFIDLVIEAQKRATREGIEANSIIINKNMVKVPSFITTDVLGGYRQLPAMFCGLNVYFTKDELPDNYSFAIFEGPSNRLAEFESIGMEPDELRKAAEIYKNIKNILEGE